MTKSLDHPDILPRLRAMALQADDRPIVEVEALLEEAAEVIETLRTLVGIRQDIELEDVEPEGRA